MNDSSTGRNDQADRGNKWVELFYRGLHSLMEYSFPKQCACCGKVFHTVEEFLAQTEAIRNLSGLKESVDDDEKPIVELFRNCTCGSTLMEVFRNRRDMSDKGLRKRYIFGQLLDMLIQQGLSHDVARQELLKILRGEDSELLHQRGISFDLHTLKETIMNEGRRAESGETPDKT